VSDHRARRADEVRQRVWHVQAREVILATGAHERSIVFGNNDLPGVMLASAARGYLNAFAVRPGREAVILTNNDSAYKTARDLALGGVSVRALIDVRRAAASPEVDRLASSGVVVVRGAAVTHAHGRRAVSGVTVAEIDDAGRPRGPSRDIACDLVCVSGGWTPAVHLHAQARGRPLYDSAIGAFVPGTSVQAERSAGAARGTFALEACIAEGDRAGGEAARNAGFEVAAGDASPIQALAPTPPLPIWSIGALPGTRYKRFVDLQSDVTDADIALAVREGYRSVEHVKRYTTLGMGTDQGKTSNTGGFAHVAAALEVDIASVGTTTFRPPYVPIALGALAGAEGGRHFMANRRTPMHDEHLARGAVMLQSGPWLRPQGYPHAGESLDDAARREAHAVRRSLGIVDVSTLGKFEVIGADAVAFLERVYVNRIQTLKVGRCRYGVMLREDGIVFDDGTVTRLSDDHYFVTSTTAQAPLLGRRLAYCREVLWPQLDVHLVHVTEQWAAVALAGPRSHDVLARVVDSRAVDNDALPYMGYAQGRIGGVASRILRISFSGERAYEIYVPAAYGAALWRRLLELGEDFGITPYGVDALNTLRIEKGHVAGGELDGRVTADDLGLARMVKADGDFIGRRGAMRPGLQDPARWQLVGLAPADGRTPVPPGAKIVAGPAHGHYLGEVTSTTWSPMLQTPIALALVSAGRSRHGQTLVATSPLAQRDVAVVVRSPAFFDPEGTRLHG
jgi:sarcosine oxidase subunit alpha